MSVVNPNMNAVARPVIRQLDEAAINRIAAGEVVERPASAVKELVENALDAGARHVAIDIAQGGKTLIRVRDDGCGMAARDLPLALARHATSKIDGSDLLDIRSFGFRGEALPSLGAVGRLTITSRASLPADDAGQDRDGGAHQVRVAGGVQEPVRPAALARGTLVELRDLFHATPARLKFLRGDRAETQAITDVVRRLAMAAPKVGFVLTDMTDGARVLLRVDPEAGDPTAARLARLACVLGRDFAENAIPVDAGREGLRLSGFAALPTYSRGAAVAQFLFVNGRPVRDKLLVGALRAAYRDVLSRDRHPAAALFVDCPPERVDVNVHPAKAEVRFREPEVARGLIVSGLRAALAEAGHRASSTLGRATLNAFTAETGPSPARIYQMDRPRQPALSRGLSQGLAEAARGWFAPSARVEETATAPDGLQGDGTPDDGPLGAARAQVHENYIIAQTATGLVIVDQHAAHERLVYERLKGQMAGTGIARQALLIPEIVTLGEAADRLLDLAGELTRFGLVIEGFGPGTIAVRETPAVLGEIDAGALLRDILDELDDHGDSQTLQARVEAVLSRVACHGSIRSGRRMRADEMNALLRQMEATPMSGQCNHGRPTYVELKLSDIERLFGRT